MFAHRFRADRELAKVLAFAVPETSGIIFHNRWIVRVFACMNGFTLQQPRRMRHDLSLYHVPAERLVQAERRDLFSDVTTAAFGNGVEIARLGLTVKDPKICRARQSA